MPPIEQSPKIPKDLTKESEIRDSLDLARRLSAPEYSGSDAAIRFFLKAELDLAKMTSESYNRQALLCLGAVSLSISVIANSARNFTHLVSGEREILSILMTCSWIAFLWAAKTFRDLSVKNMLEAELLFRNEAVRRHTDVVFNRSLEFDVERDLEDELRLSEAKMGHLKTMENMQRELRTISPDSYGKVETAVIMMFSGFVCSAIAAIFITILL